MKTRQIGICEGCGMEFDDLVEGHAHEQHCDKMVTVYTVDVKFDIGYRTDLVIDIDKGVYPTDRIKTFALDKPNVDKSATGLYWCQCTLDKSEIPAIEEKLRKMAHDDIMKYADEALTKEARRYYEG